MILIIPNLKLTHTYIYIHKIYNNFNENSLNKSIVSPISPSINDTSHSFLSSKIKKKYPYILRYVSITPRWTRNTGKTQGRRKRNRFIIDFQDFLINGRWKAHHNQTYVHYFRAERVTPTAIISSTRASCPSRAGRLIRHDGTWR